MAHGYFNLPGGGRGRDAGVSGLKLKPVATHARITREMDNRARAAVGLQSHHADVPAHGSGGHGGGNPNHDEHGRFA